MKEEELGKLGLVIYRDITPTDEPFILATWVHGLYHGNSKDSWISAIPEDVFNAHYRNVVKTILKSATVNLAALKDDPEIILGYSVVSRGDTLHWIYVKKHWRKVGLAKSLYPTTIKYVTHISDIGRSLKQKLNLTFDPFRI